MLLLSFEFVQLKVQKQESSRSERDPRFEFYPLVYDGADQRTSRVSTITTNLVQDRKRIPVQRSLTTCSTY